MKYMGEHKTVKELQEIYEDQEPLWDEDEELNASLGYIVNE